MPVGLLGSPEKNFVDSMLADLFPLNGKIKTQRMYRTVRLATFSIPETDILTDLFSFLLFHCQRFQSPWLQKTYKNTMYGLTQHSAFSFERDYRPQHQANSVP